MDWFRWAPTLAALALSTVGLAQGTGWTKDASSSIPEPPFKLDLRLLEDQLVPLVCTQTPRSIDPGANDCPRDQIGQTEACCIWNIPNQGLSQPMCTQWGRGIQYLDQVGKGLCCISLPPGTPFVRFEKMDELCGFCAGRTPTLDECCTIDKEVIPAYPVTDKSLCPGLRQDSDHPPTVSVPPCGSESMIQKGYKIPQGAGPVPFNIPCANHDICYSSCGSSKSGCDTSFRLSLKQVCEDYWAPLMANPANDVEAQNLEASLSYCTTFGEVYYQVVSKGGQGAFDDAQKQVCRCCIGGPNVPF